MKVDACGTGDRSKGSFVFERGAKADSFQGDSSIDSARVNIEITQSARQGFADRALTEREGPSLAITICSYVPCTGGPHVAAPVARLSRAARRAARTG